MSISSCPRCAQRIMIPPGASSTANVRCPLCSEQYTLADVLVQTAPMLEIVDAISQSVPDEWLAPSSEPEAGPAEPRVAAESDFAVDIAAEPQADIEAPGSSEPGDQVGFDDELTFDEEPAPNAQIEHDDLVMHDQDKDTDVEELGFATSEPLVREVPQDLEPLEIASSEEDTVFELDPPAPDVGQTAEPGPAAELGEEDREVELGDFKLDEEPDAKAATVEFPASQPVEEPAFDEGPVFELEELTSDGAQVSEPSPAAPSAEEQPESEFSEFQAVEESDARSEATIDFEEFAPADGQAAEQEIELDFGEPQPDDVAPADAATIEIEHRIPASAAGDAEEIELDFGEPVVSEAEPAAAQEAAEEPAAKKGKKAKKKKTPLELGEDAKPRGSRVGMLVSILLGAVVGLPLTFYGMLWVGKDFDFLGVGPTLASYGVPLPAAFSKAQRGTVVAEASQPLAAAPGAQPAAPQTPPANESPATEPMPATETAPAQPDDAAAEPPADNASEPAAKPPAEHPPAAGTEAPTPSEPSAPDPTLPAPPSEPSAEAKPLLADDKPTESPPADANADKQPSTEPVPVTAAKPAEMPDESPQARSAETLPEPPDETPKLDDPAPVPPELDEPAAADARQYSLADLAKAMQEAGVSSQKLLAAQTAKDEAALKTARAQFYLKMFAMAEVLTLTNDESANGQLAAERQAIEQIMLQFAADKKRLDALKYNAGRWMDFSKRTTPGVIVAGTVQSCEPLGKLFEVKLGIGVSNDSPIVTVLHKADPRLAQGDQVLLLGVIVDNPTEKVAGYEGLESTAIWNGLTMKLPAAK